MGMGYFFHNANNWPQQPFEVMSLGLWGLTDTTGVCRTPSHHGQDKEQPYVVTEKQKCAVLPAQLYALFPSYSSGWFPIHAPHSQKRLLLVWGLNKLWKFFTVYFIFSLLHSQNSSWRISPARLPLAFQDSHHASLGSHHCFSDGQKLAASGPIDFSHV